LRISEITGKKAEVAALDTKIVAAAVIPVVKLGLPMTRYPRS
jgi:hypothetical protein